MFCLFARLFPVKTSLKSSGTNISPIEPGLDGDPA
jgi:hypothetical protein